MTRAEDLLPPDEQARLDECASEPIHVPGSVQPHGVLLAVEPASTVVVQLSANSGQLLGIEPAELLGARWTSSCHGRPRSRCSGR